MATDFVLRLIEQIGIMLAQLMGLRGRERAEKISALCMRETGLPFELVKHSAPETLIEMLRSGGATEHPRAVILAELLLADAKESERVANLHAAAISRAQAAALLAHSVTFLEPDEQAIYSAKLRQLRDAGFIPVTEQSR